MNVGNIIFSPISHSHPVADHLHPELRTSQEFWMHQDMEMIKRCDDVVLIVVGDDGEDLIKNSSGCQSEIKKAKELGMEIRRFHYLDLQTK